MSMVISPLLMLLSLVYESAIRARNFLYDKCIFASYRSSLPVVSIGNATVGGSGKTPLCEWLARACVARGKKPVILTRGYGGSVRMPRVVVDGDTAQEVGDEPLILRNRAGVPVVVARRKVDGAKFIESHSLGDLIIVDDGLQHRALARDLNILSVSCGTEELARAFVRGRLLPWGEFREPRGSAIARTDFIVLNHRRIEDPDAREREALVSAVLPPSAPRASAFVTLDIVMTGGGRVVLPGPIVVLSGIAHPEGFLETLRSAGYSIEDTYRFSDHHPFSSEEMHAVQQSARGRQLVTTEKDAVRIPPEFRAEVGIARTSLRFTNTKVIDEVLDALLQATSQRNPLRMGE